MALMSTATMDLPVRVASRPAPHRRFLKWIVAGLVIALVVAGVAYVSTYQPLVPGNYGLGPEYESPITMPGLTDRRTVPYVEGAAMLWGFSVRNDGLFAVTVTGAEWLGSAGPFRNVTFLISKADPLGVGPEFVGPMHPVTLAPGQQAVVVARVVMSGCTVSPGSPGNGSFGFQVDSLTIDSRAFGISHVTTIPAGALGGFQISVPGSATCS